MKISLLYDARPCTNVLTTEVITKFGQTVLMYPPFSPDLSPSDFHLFGPLKDSLSGQHYCTDDKAPQNAMH